MKKRYLIILIAIAIIFLALFGVYLIKKYSPKYYYNSIRNFEFENQKEIFIDGKVEPKNKKDIYLEKDAIDYQLLVKDGDKVNRGDVLFIYKGKNNKTNKVLAEIDGVVIINGSKEKSKPFITIRSREMYVDCIVSDKYKNKLKNNQIVSIKVGGTNIRVKGKVFKIHNIPMKSTMISENYGVNLDKNSTYYKVGISFFSEYKIKENTYVQIVIS
ncbi:efflux RND transporter periplasmic adaptor subunit [Clostridium sp. Ade.TY]|uniref:efflux RND transporter periplasmic adaptor subunit n=1 Tax=Clostridium sp. Ade.TY TaxID=1391647 RepID=UPI0004267985|nr:efflux RND transporter periplasmic adaptor subunit [Clostridium sp. Ade.TY]